MAAGRGDGRRRLVGLVVARLTRRGSGASRSLRAAPWLATSLALAAGSLLVIGDGHPLAAVTLCVCVLLAGTLAAVRVFTTMYAIAVVGIALGVASLTTVLAVASGFERELARTFASVHGQVVLTKYGLDFFEHARVAEVARADPRVIAASPFAWGSGAVVREELGEPADAEREGARGPAVVVVKGMLVEDLDGLAGLRESLVVGDDAALRPADPGVLPGLVVGERLARRLGVARGAAVAVVVPAAIRGAHEDPHAPARRASFEVTDLLRTGNEEIDGHLVLMHLTAAQSLLFGEARVSGIELTLADPRDAVDVAAELESRLRPAGAPRLYRTTTWIEQSAAVQALRQARAVISIVVGLMVLVSFTGLVSALVLSVRRKRPQIAMLMALGADRRLIFWVFESVGLRIAAVGAAGGVVLAAIVCAALAAMHLPLDPAVYPLDHLPVALRASDALAPALAAVALAAAVSGPIAHRAAATRPLELLGG